MEGKRWPWNTGFQCYNSCLVSAFSDQWLNSRQPFLGLSASAVARGHAVVTNPLRGMGPNVGIGDGRYRAAAGHLESGLTGPPSRLSHSLSKRPQCMCARCCAPRGSTLKGDTDTKHLTAVTGRSVSEIRILELGFSPSCKSRERGTRIWLLTLLKTTY